MSPEERRDIAQGYVSQLFVNNPTLSGLPPDDAALIRSDPLAYARRRIQELRRRPPPWPEVESLFLVACAVHGDRTALLDLLPWLRRPSVSGHELGYFKVLMFFLPVRYPAAAAWIESHASTLSWDEAGWTYTA